MNFFFDRNFPRPIARMLGHFERDHNVVHQDDDGQFSPDSEDVHIINTLAARSPSPVWITADLSQKRVPSERAALRNSGMTIFFCKRASRLTPHIQTLKMIAVWPALVKAAETAKVPTAFEVPFGKIGAKLNEKIERICNTAELS